MKLGIIGTGKLAGALGQSLTRKGYNIMFGSRELAKANNLAGEMERGARGGTIASAIQYGEIVFLAVPYKSVEEVLRSTDNYRGKIVVDCTNPLVPGNPPQLALGYRTSGAEQIAKMIPEASVIKAFNTAFYELVESGPFFGPNDGSMFYCGDDEKDREAIGKVIEATGFEPIDCGPLESARLLEPLALLLIRLGTTQGRGRDIAFKLLQRE